MQFSGKTTATATTFGMRAGPSALLNTTQLNDYDLQFLGKISLESDWNFLEKNHSKSVHFPKLFLKILLFCRISKLFTNFFVQTWLVTLQEISTFLIFSSQRACLPTAIRCIRELLAFFTNFWLIRRKYAFKKLKKCFWVCECEQGWDRAGPGPSRA